VLRWKKIWGKPIFGECSMSIYDYEDYKEWFNAWVTSQPKGGHGEYRKLSLDLGVSTTLISQIFKGDKHASLEMAIEIGEYLNLEEGEVEYLLLLIEFAKAGSVKLKARYKKMVKTRQETARKLENRVKKTIELPEEAKAIFYSSWIYSGVRLATDIPKIKDIGMIAELLKLPKNQVQKVVEFLVQNHLVIIKDNNLHLGPGRIYIGSSNHLVVRYHQNWRLQGFQKMVQSDGDNFFYTSPMVLSEEVAQKIRQELPNFVEKIAKWVQPSNSEVLRCLNIDWFAND
jgi:uncharacterized protein (TIGR02147 family)